MADTDGWGTRVGFILAAVGSAIGLGNIWRFPYQVAQNGGGAFLIPYFTALLLAGIPVLIIEIWLGSETGLTTPLAIREKFRESEFLGWWAVLNGFLVNAYYVVILGWALAFIVFSFTHDFTGDTMTFFADFLTSWQPVAGVLAVWGLNYVVLRLGIQDGLERGNKLLVPLIWVLVILLAIRGLTLPGGLEGLNYYLTPDFGALTDPGLWISAFGQIYFTLSVALGIMVTYSSYQPSGQDITNNAFIIALANTGFAFLVGFAIFPYMTATGVSPDSGIALSFIVLPKAFAQVPLTALLGGVFFTLLTMAGLSSSLSLAEAQIGPLQQKLDLDRSVTVNAVVGGGLLLSLAIAAEGPLGLLTAGEGMGSSLELLTLFDTSSTTYTLPMIALGETLIFAWVYGADRIREAANEVSDVEMSRWWFDLTLRFVVPVALGYTILSSVVKKPGLIAPLVIIISAAVASYVKDRSEAVTDEATPEGGEQA